MMRTILKYNLDIYSGGRFYLPEGSKVLHVDEQYGNLTLWIEQPTLTSVSWPYNFNVYATGQTFPDDDVYIGTVLMSDSFVWHVYQTK